MSGDGNGEKSKTIWFLLGLIQSVVLVLLYWVCTTLVEAKTNIATLTANYTTIQASLTRIENSIPKK